MVGTSSDRIGAFRRRERDTGADSSPPAAQVRTQRESSYLQARKRAHPRNQSLPDLHPGLPELG